MALGNVGSMAVALLGDMKDFDRKMDGATKKVSTFDKTVGKMGKAVTKAAKAAALAAAAAVTAFAASSIKTFVEFDTQMRQVFTLMPDLSAEAKDVMIEDVMELSEAIGILPSEIIPALYQAISAGVPRENVFTYLEVAGEAAIGGAVQLESMVVGLAQVMNAYGAEVDTARGYSDTFFSIVADGITTMEELSGELFKVAPTAADLGIAFSDIAGWLAELTSQGTPAAVATSRMNVALGELSKSGTIASDTFEKAAGITFPAFIDAGGDLADAFKIIGDYASDNEISVKDMFGSIEAGGVVLQATGVHFDPFIEKVKNAEEAAGNTKTAYKEMADGIQHELDRIAAWWEVLRTDIGKDLTVNLRELLTWLQDNQQAIGDGITAVFDGLITSLKWLQEHATLVKASLVTVAAGFTLLWIAANPVAAAILAAVAALAYFESTGGVAGLYDEMQDLAQAFRDFTTAEEEASAVTEAMAEVMTSTLVEAGNAIQTYLDAAKESGKEIEGAWGEIESAQEKALKDLKKGVRFDVVLKSFSTMVTDVLKKYGVLDKDITVLLDAILESTSDMWSEATGVVVGSVEEIDEAVTVSFESQIDAIEEVRIALAAYRDGMADTETAATTTARGIERAQDIILNATDADVAAAIAAMRAKVGAVTEWGTQYRDIVASTVSDVAWSLATFYRDSKLESEAHEIRMQEIRTQYADGSQADLDAALLKEETAYEESRTKVTTIISDGFKDMVNAIAQSALETTLTDMVTGFWDMATAAEGASTAAATSLSAIVTPLLAIAGLFVVISDLLSGKSTGVAAINKWLTDLLYGEGTYDSHRDNVPTITGPITGITIPGYAAGGIVPGPIGAAQMAVVHGGEEVLTPEDRAAGGIDYELLGQAVAAGFMDAQDERGGNGGSSGSSSDILTRLAQLLYNPTEVERERRGGAV